MSLQTHECCHSQFGEVVTVGVPEEVRNQIVRLVIMNGQTLLWYNHLRTDPRVLHRRGQGRGAGRVVRGARRAGIKGKGEGKSGESGVERKLRVPPTERRLRPRKVVRDSEAIAQGFDVKVCPWLAGHPTALHESRRLRRGG